MTQFLIIGNDLLQYNVTIIQVCHDYLYQETRSLLKCNMWQVRYEHKTFSVKILAYLTHVPSLKPKVLTTNLLLYEQIQLRPWAGPQSQCLWKMVRLTCNVENLFMPLRQRFLHILKGLVNYFLHCYIQCNQQQHQQQFIQSIYNLPEFQFSQDIA